MYRIVEGVVVTAWNLIRDRKERKPPREVKEQDGDTVLLGHLRGAGNADPVSLSLTEKCRHIYLVGASGMGKTNLLLQLLLDDAKHRRGLCLLDPRGDLVDRTLMGLAAEFTPEEIGNRLFLIDLRSTEYAAGCNPLASASDPYTNVAFLMDVLKMQWGAPLGPQTEEIMRNALLALASANPPYTLLELEPLLSSARFRSELVSTVQDIPCRQFFSRFEATETRSAQITPVLNKITPLLSRPQIRNVVSQRECLSFQNLLNRGEAPIVLIALGSDELYQAANLMSTLLFSALLSSAMKSERLNSKHPIFVYADEFENFTGTGELFEKGLAEGRRFGLGLCLSHQTTGQLEPRLRNLIRNVVGTQIFFSCGATDADLLASEIVSEEPKAALRHMLMQQKPGEAIVIRRGKPYAPIRTLLRPDPPVSPERVEALRQRALAESGRRREEIERELEERHRRITGEESPANTSSQPNLVEVRDYVQTPPAGIRRRSRTQGE